MIYDSQESGAALSEMTAEDAAIKKRLEESERKYRNLVHSIAEYVYSVKIVDGRVASAYHSPRCVDITGYSPEEYQADPDLWSKMIHPEDREMALNYFRNFIPKTAPKPLEHRIIRKDGSVRWALNHTTTTVAEEGGRIRLDGVVLDITARKEAELALAESEERYRNLVENANDIIITIGLDGAITSINKKSLARSGFFAEEVINHNISEFLDPVTMRRIRKVIGDIASGSEMMEGIEIDLFSKNGKRVTKEFTLQPIFRNGKIAGAQGLGRDITRRKFAEETLMETQRLLNTLNRIQSLYISTKEPAAVFNELLDAVLAFTSSEFGFIGEYSDDSASPFILMHSISDIAGGEDIPQSKESKYRSNMVFDRMDNLIGEVLKTGAPVISNDPRNDSRSRGLPKGHRQIRSFMGIPLIKGADLVGIIGIANRRNGYNLDFATKLKPITSVCGYIIDDYRNQKRRMEYEKAIVLEKEKAEDSAKLKDKFISLVAHDIRSPFVSMLGLMSLVKDNGMGELNEKQTAALTRAVDAGENLLRMVDDLLNLNRLQTGRIIVQPRFMDANMIAGGTIARLEHLAERKGIQLVNNVPAGARIYADPALFNEVILNFVTNSIKFTNAGGEVDIFIPSNSPTTISVRDTGIGVAAEVVPNLFRCDVPTSTRGTNGERGTGLGLPLSHEIMTAHGGSIEIESQPGRGSVFHANLPFVEPIVLIVEDDPDERFVFRNRLETMSAKVCEAANGVEGLSIAIRQQPHLIIADIHMPVMDGFEMIKKLKQDPKTSMIPLIVMTSSSSIEKREEVLRLGADDFVTKPIVENEFIPRIRRFIC